MGPVRLLSQSSKFIMQVKNAFFLFSLRLSPRLDNFCEKIGAKTPVNYYTAIHC